MDIFCAYRGTFLASMTRYTKLDGRRSVAYGPSDMDREDVTPEKPRELCGPVSYTHLTLPTNREV